MSVLVASWRFRVAVLTVSLVAGCNAILGVDSDYVVGTTPSGSGATGATTDVGGAGATDVGGNAQLGGGGHGGSGGTTAVGGGGSAANGVPCEVGAECQSGRCVDDVCCATECAGVCSACTAEYTGGEDGVCEPIVLGIDPDSECPETQVCDGAGNCRSETVGTVLFSDDFESGNLANWTLSGPGAAWDPGTDFAAAGMYTAHARPVTTEEPGSVMERAVSTAGRSTIVVEYDRYVIGIDAADEFRVSWFDGAAWLVLEQTGDQTLSDNAHVHRTWALPSAANDNPGVRIQFSCTAGATSEQCNVDNVVVSASE